METQVLDNKSTDSNKIDKPIVNFSQIFVREYPLPPLVTKFPIKRNPLHDSPQVKEWLNSIKDTNSSVGLKEIQGLGLFCAHFYPFCDDIQRYEYMLKHNIIWFICDDHAELDYKNHANDPKEMLKTILQLLELFESLSNQKDIPINDWQPCVSALYSALKPIYYSFNEIQKRRFITGWHVFIQGIIEETRHKTSGKQFSAFKQYNELRIKSIGIWAALQAIEFGDGLFIPETVWEDPLFQRLLNLLSLHAGYVNDFFSFEKEFKDNNKDPLKLFNAVAVLALVDGIPINESLIKLTQIIGDIEEKILIIENKIINNKNCLEVTKDFIDKINHFVGGNYRASSLVNRYNQL